uniref:DoxX family protein n=1 Tax=Solibacter usitatus (strain Ellin6076) TaxID=234267 RepID=Q021Y0_SOLUE
MDRSGTIRSMNDSMAQAGPGLTALEVPGWKSVLSWVSAILLGGLFLASGLWKITDIQGTAVRMAQAKVPDALGLPAALFFGIAETVGAVMILVPRLRRWGAMLLAGMLLAFLGYFAFNYTALRGADCSCIPWLKRVVGPGFFIGDGAMLAMAAFAWLGARRSQGKRTVALIAGAVAVFAAVSFGVGEARQTGTKAPESILVDGKTYSLQHGKVFLYFFDPQCMHCFDAAKKMSQLHWGDTRVVGVPISQPRYAPQFKLDTGFSMMAITSDLEKLKQVFPYVGVPAGVALENGREKAALTKFDGDEPAASLKQFGLVE